MNLKCCLFFCVVACSLITCDMLSIEPSKETDGIKTDFNSRQQFLEELRFNTTQLLLKNGDNVVAINGNEDDDKQTRRTFFRTKGNKKNRKGINPKKSSILVKPIVNKPATTILKPQKEEAKPVKVEFISQKPQKQEITTQKMIAEDKATLAPETTRKLLPQELVSSEEIRGKLDEKFDSKFQEVSIQEKQDPYKNIIADMSS